MSHASNAAANMARRDEIERLLAKEKLTDGLGVSYANIIKLFRRYQKLHRTQDKRIAELKTFDIKTERIASDARESALTTRIDELEEFVSSEYISMKNYVEERAALHAENKRLIEICAHHQTKIKKLESRMAIPRMEDIEEINRLNARIDELEGALQQYANQTISHPNVARITLARGEQ